MVKEVSAQPWSGPLSQQAMMKRGALQLLFMQSVWFGLSPVLSSALPFKHRHDSEQ